MNKKRIKEILIELENNNEIYFDISYRGGKYGIDAWKLIDVLFPEKDTDFKASIVDNLPNGVGVYCNYLGGGLRGAICCSSIYNVKQQYVRRILSIFIELCKKRYEEIENGEYLNEEVLPNGETNYEALGTNRCRKAGVKSVL